MRLLIFATALPALLVGLFLALDGLTQTLGGALPFENSNTWWELAAAGGLTFITGGLLLKQPSSPWTWHWFYFLGLACIGLALIAVLHEIAETEHPQSYPEYSEWSLVWLFCRMLPIPIKIALGVSLISSAVIRDLLGAPINRKKKR